MQHINAHGAGTIKGDSVESQALKAAFGQQLNQIPVTSIKVRNMALI